MTRIRLNLNQYLLRYAAKVIDIDGKYLYILIFAYDEVVIANGELNILYIRRKLTEVLKKWDFEVNDSKTKYLPL